AQATNAVATGAIAQTTSSVAQAAGVGTDTSTVTRTAVPNRTVAHGAGVPSYRYTVAGVGIVRDLCGRRGGPRAEPQRGPERQDHQQSPHQHHSSSVASI